MASFFRTKFKIPNKLKNPFKKTPAALENGDAANQPPKIKLRTKAYNYLKNIYIDYKYVAVETVKGADERPFKALGYGICLASMLVFYKKNPTQHDYENKRIELVNDLIMCGTTHSARSENYLNEINRLENLNLIEYRSFLIFSLILIKKFNDYDCNYENRCPQLNNPNKFNIFNSFNLFLRAFARIIDIGFCGEWYFLNKNFKDYDIDEKEWIVANKKQT